jgi:two-component system response regulator ParR
MLNTGSRPFTANACAQASGMLRVAIATDDIEALQSWRREFDAEGIRADRMTAGATAQIYVLHLQGSVGCHFPQLRELRERVPLAPLAVWCKSLRDLDQVLALEAGADDVVDAASVSSVLAARLRALWRRCARAGDATSTPDELRFGLLSLQRHARRAVLGTREVLLTEGEFDVLWLLASRAGTTVSRQEILQRVRGLDETQLDRSIDSRVYRLRVKLRDGDRALLRIATVRNRGYVFTPLGW